MRDSTKETQYLYNLWYFQYQRLYWRVRLKLTLKDKTNKYDTLHPRSYQCQSPESGLIQNHLGLNKTGLCPRLETTMTRQGLGAPSLSLLANSTILHTTLPCHIQPYRATFNLTKPHKTLPCHIQPHQATQTHIKQSLSCPSVRACGLDLSCIRTRSVRSKEASPPAGLDIRTRVDLIMDLYTLLSFLISRAKIY